MCECAKVLEHIRTFAQALRTFGALRGHTLLCSVRVTSPAAPARPKSGPNNMPTYDHEIRASDMVVLADDERYHD